MMAAPELRPADAGDAGPGRIDLGPVTKRVLRSLAGELPRERIERLLAELLEHGFSSARVTTFLPIFLRRVACETLRRELTATTAPRH